MKYFRFFAVLFSVTFLIQVSWAQNRDKPSEIYTSITIPAFVDFIEKIEWTNPKITDTENKWSDNAIDIYIDLKYVPLDAGRSDFTGSFTENLMPFATYMISGNVSADRKMLRQLVVKKNAEYSKGGYEFTEKWKVTISDMPLINGTGQFNKEKTKVQIDGYEYKTVDNLGNRVEYKDKIFKSVNNDKLLPPPFGSNFHIRINVDGPPSFTIKIEDVRGPDTTWNPPAAVANPGYFVDDTEPNSLRCYKDNEGLDETSDFWTANFVEAHILGNLIRLPGLKILEKSNLKRIYDEIDLSQSGLVKEETSIKKGKLFKEEVAIIARVNIPGGVAFINIQSRTGEKKVVISNLTLQNKDYAFEAARKEVIRLANNYLTGKLIPDYIYK
jgi:hypothetical protein